MILDVVQAIMKKPNLHLPVTIESQPSDEKRGIILRNIPCRIYLPVQRHEKVVAHLDLHAGHADIIGTFGNSFWKMSFRGWLRHGGRLWQVEASEAYINNGDWPMIGHDQSFQVIDLPLEVLDLQITDVALDELRDNPSEEAKVGQRQRSAKPRKLPEASKKALVTFWLTYNKMLTPFHVEEQRFDGQIKVRSQKPIKLPISSALTAEFSKHYTWNNSVEPYELSRRKELVAQIELPPQGKTPVRVSEEIIKHLDDLLLFASVGSRWRTICLGWKIGQFPYSIKRYRHGLTLPKHLTDSRRLIEQDYDDALISPQHYHVFLRHCHKLFLAMPKDQQELMRQVMPSTVHAQGLDVQSGFITLYSALEMMVLYFRRKENLELLLPQNEWSVLESDLKKFLKQHSLLSGDSDERKTRRKRAYEKVAEFNRIAFGTAFQEFCQSASHPVKHDDLWPVSGEKSLSNLRNNLVHGVVEGRELTNPLADAKIHMQWLVERCITAVFNWPLDKSQLCPSMLNYFLPYYPDNLQASRNVLFQHLEKHN